MNSHTLPDLLHAYVDGELDVAHTLEVEQHVRGCADCARLCDQIRTSSAALRAALPRFEPSDGLRVRIRAALPGQSLERRSHPVRWLALAASVVFVVLGGAASIRFWPASSGRERLVQEVVDSHVRSQLADHLLDVEESNRHIVKPWFQGKLDFAPVVTDLSAEGFVLAGGRLDYLNGRPVAALVYRRRQHVVNLLVWPAPAGEKDTEIQSETTQGYHLVHWCQQGMVHWAVSDLNPEEIAEFARLIRRQE